MKESFISHVFSDFQSYCTSKRIQPSIALFLDYLINQNLIPDTAVRHFVVLSEFQALQEKKFFKNKTQTVEAIAEVYGLHNNTIWNILKDHNNKFQLSGK